MDMQQSAELLVLAIGRQIRVEMTSKDMTQQQLADAIGIERATLSRYLNGKPMPLMVYLRVAEALGLSPQVLMLRAEDRVGQADQTA